MTETKTLDTMTDEECLDAELQFYWAHGSLQKHREAMVDTLQKFALHSVTIDADGTLTWSRSPI